MVSTRTSPGPGDTTVFARSTALRGAVNQRALVSSSAPIRAAIRIFDASAEDEIHPVRFHCGVGEGEGPGQVADTEVADGFYAVAQNLGRDANGEPVDQPPLKKLVIKVAPPSIITDSTPDAANSPSRDARSTRPSTSEGSFMTVAPTERALSRRFAGARSVTAKTVPGAAPFASTAASGGVRRVLSTTTRRGLVPGTWRTVRRGSSLQTVPAPMRTASWPARISWAKRRESGQLIHFDSPVAVATRPSSVCA